MSFNGASSISRGSPSRLEPWTVQARQTSPLEDQFFNILRDAIIRAERRPPSPSNITSTIRRVSPGTGVSRSTTAETGTNTDPANFSESEP